MFRKLTLVRVSLAILVLALNCSICLQPIAASHSHSGAHRTKRSHHPFRGSIHHVRPAPSFVGSFHTTAPSFVGSFHVSSRSFVPRPLSISTHPPRPGPSFVGSFHTPKSPVFVKPHHGSSHHWFKPPVVHLSLKSSYSSHHRSPVPSFHSPSSVVHLKVVPSPPHKQSHGPEPSYHPPVSVIHLKLPSGRGPSFVGTFHTSHKSHMSLKPLSFHSSPKPVTIVETSEEDEEEDDEDEGDDGEQDDDDEDDDSIKFT